MPLFRRRQLAHQSQQQAQSRGHLDYNQAIACENQSDDNEGASNSLLKLNDEKPPKLIHEDGVCFELIIAFLGSN